jgi:hypothetical protein
MLTWILCAVTGIVAGLVLSRTAFARDIGSKQARVMILVWTAIFVVFAVLPWIRPLIGLRFQSWRLFGVYRWGSILAISAARPAC